MLLDYQHIIDDPVLEAVDSTFPTSFDNDQPPKGVQRDLVYGLILLDSLGTVDNTGTAVKPSSKVNGHTKALQNWIFTRAQGGPDLWLKTDAYHDTEVVNGVATHTDTFTQEP